MVILVPMHFQHQHTTQRGFTIVELLVVIAVVGILAAVVIVAFNGVRDRATQATTQSELKTTATKLTTLRFDQDDESYPASLEAAGIENTDSTSFQYTYSAVDNTFCLSATSVATPTISYHVESANSLTIESGLCDGHSAGVPLVASFEQLTNSGSRAWRAVASSDDGTKLAAFPTTGYVFTSSDSGQTWQQQNGSGYLSRASISSSADGTRLAAVTSSYIYISTDSGVTWTQATTSPASINWQAIASSNDGLKLAAASTGGSGYYVYTSTNGGTAWTQRTGMGTSGWQSIDSSGDGNHLLISSGGGGTNGYIKYSHDSGATWSTVTSLGTASRWGVAISDDGQTMYAGPNSPTGNIVRSTDGGSTWTALSGSGDNQWRGLDSSADGTIVVGIARDTGHVYYSQDSGDTWEINTSFNTTMRYLACNASCTQVILADSNGYLHKMTLE